MNILEKRDYHKEQYKELDMLIETVDVYLSSYDTDGKSVDDMMNDFFHVFGKYDITNKDFVHIAKSLGYEYRRICVNDVRYYTLVRE